MNNNKYLVVTNEENTIICILKEDSYISEPLINGLQEHYDMNVTIQSISEPSTQDYSITVKIEVGDNDEVEYEEVITLTPAFLYK